jgi:hypothetical protein
MGCAATHLTADNRVSLTGVGEWPADCVLDYATGADELRELALDAMAAAGELDTLD